MPSLDSVQVYDAANTLVNYSCAAADDTVFSPESNTQYTFKVDEGIKVLEVTTENVDEITSWPPPKMVHISP